MLGVFHRLVSSNVDVCPKRAFGAGWLLHAANQYSAPMRDMLIVDGLEGDLPAVSATAPGGPAAKAGLARGDVVMSVDGVELKAGATADRARYEGVEANLKVLEAALVDGGPLTMEIRREGVVREVVVVPEAVCAYDVHLDVSDELNARADGSSVHISSALARFALTDDELAVILGHELAHNVLEHRDILDREAPARRVFGNLAVAPGRLERVEREADRVGLFLMARADFAYEIAPAFWRRFGESNWRVRWAQWGHPSAAERARQLDVVVAEIRGTGLSGRSLTY
ncbi:MAG: M48 family metalloprotease [Alphaproteobacteria bacterium]|nr:M48 family metalloprotease [Alphaproteobacteria bacterium]